MLGTQDLVGVGQGLESSDLSIDLKAVGGEEWIE